MYNILSIGGATVFVMPCSSKNPDPEPQDIGICKTKPNPEPKRQVLEKENGD